MWGMCLSKMVYPGFDGTDSFVGKATVLMLACIISAMETVSDDITFYGLFFFFMYMVDIGYFTSKRGKKAYVHCPKFFNFSLKRKPYNNTNNLITEYMAITKLMSIFVLYIIRL